MITIEFLLQDEELFFIIQIFFNTDYSTIMQTKSHLLVILYFFWHYYIIRCGFKVHHRERLSNLIYGGTGSILSSSGTPFDKKVEPVTFSIFFPGKNDEIVRST